MTVPDPDSELPKTLWAYAYEIDPPRGVDSLRRIRAFIDREGSEARLGSRTWEGRFVLEERVSHILVVSDRPDQDLEVNRRLEAELEELGVTYSRTLPLAVADPHPPATGMGPRIHLDP